MRLKLVENDLLLLPGLDGTGELFTPLAGVLPAEYPASVVSYPADTPVAYRDLIPWIRRRMPWGKPVTLVAESYSGPAAIEFAAAQPESVRAVVLVCSFVRNPLPIWGRWIQPALNDFWLRKGPPAAVLRQLFLGSDSPPLLVDALKAALQSNRPEVLAHRLQEIVDLDARMALTRCRKPILYLLATEDRFAGRRGWESVMAVKPDITTVSIEGPHLLLQRKPRESFMAIAQFVEDLRPLPSPRQPTATAPSPPIAAKPAEAVSRERSKPVPDSVRPVFQSQTRWRSR